MVVATLSPSIRANLLTLNQVESLYSRTQKRLSTGLAVAEPWDDPVKFFSARSLSTRAQNFLSRKDEIDQGISSLTVAINSSKAIESLIVQMKGVIEGARSGTESQRQQVGTDLSRLADQIQKLVGDASYRGINLLNSSGTKLVVRFSDRAESKLAIQGRDMSLGSLFLDTDGTSLNLSSAAGIAAALGLDSPSSSQKSGADQIAKAANQGSDAGQDDRDGWALGQTKTGSKDDHRGWALGHTKHGHHGHTPSDPTPPSDPGNPDPTSPGSNEEDELAVINLQADEALARLDRTIAGLQAKSASFTHDLSILQVRLDFTKDYVNTLSEGAD